MINYMEVLKTASLLPNMNFIIKFHPNEDLLFRSHLVNDFNKNKNIVVLNMTLLILLMQAIFV